MTTVESNRALIAAGITTRAQTLGQQVISNQSAEFENGIFWQSNMANTQHNLKFAALMATLIRNMTSDTLKAQYVSQIVESVERNLATNAVNGIWTGGGITEYGDYYQGPSVLEMDAANDPTVTIPMTVDLAWIVHQLPIGLIPSVTRNRWIKVCQDNCDLLDTWPGTPITMFYINGNYMAHLWSCYGLTATISRSAQSAKYWDMYERAYTFMLYPNTVTPGRWVNYGLTITVTGTDYNWDDYEAHLSENHGEVPGPLVNFDPSYTLYTTDILSRAWVVMRDTRCVRLINALGNALNIKILDETGVPPWTLDGRGGSRQNNYTNMACAYLPVQGMIREKQWLTDLTTPAKIFSCWDTLTVSGVQANGWLTMYQEGSAEAAGRMSAIAVAGLANIATVRYCAELTTVSVAAS